MKKLIGLLFLSSLVFGCASHDRGTLETSDALETLITRSDFEITSRWAEPQLTSAMVQLSNAGLLSQGSTAGQIDIVGTSNFLKVHKDKVEARLPFFGERRFGAVYGQADTGIVFEGAPQDYQVEKNKKTGYEIRFSINDKNTRSENYKVSIHLLPNLSSIITINSTHRLTIRYRGSANLIESEGS